MKDKAIIAAFLGLSFVSAQTVSLSDLLKNKTIEQKVPTVDPVIVNQDVDADFVDYKVELGDSYLPCLGKDNCGEAKSFQSQKEFNSFLSEYVSENQPDIFIKNPNIFLQPSVLPSVQPIMMQTQAQAFSVAPTDSAKTISSGSVVAGRDFSGTNNQVQGVDEADLLKTDGTYIYTISGRKLNVVLAYPSNRANVVSSIDLGNLNAEALFIEGNYLAIFGTDYSTSRAFTFVRIYNVRNRAQPYIEYNFKVEGSYTNGRKTSNGYVYLVANQYLYSRIIPWYDFGVGQKFIPWNNIFYYPGKYNSPQLTNILSFNLGSPSNADRKVVSICGETSNLMYMSEKSIYLTSSTYTNGETWTRIRKIFVNRRHIIPFADGQVRGSVNNQFSLDEYGPYFRVATTSNNNLGQTSNNVFTLGYALQNCGALTNIAPTQRIFSARYMGRKLYLVTFRQIDPFFVISLANHNRPVVLGELKIPGFSRYLHPYDENTIVGIGRQADANGRQLGPKISLFNVKDPRNPIELTNFQLQDTYASSNAEWQHKAFLLSTQKNLLVIPISMNSADLKFNGALAFYVDKKTIQIKALIDHLVNVNDNFYDRNVERSLYIEQLLLSKSKCLIKINSLKNNFADVKDIKLPCENRNYGGIYDPIPLPIVRPIRQFVTAQPQIFQAPILVKSLQANIAV